MDADPRKKEDEHRLVAFLLHRLVQPPVPTPTPHERPDWIVRIGGKIVGIEVTRINVQSDGVPFRQMEGIERLISERAMQIAIERGVPPAFVRLFFTRTSIPRKTDVERIASGVASAVAECMPENGATATLEYPHASAHQPIEVDEILISRYMPEIHHDWSETSAHKIESDVRAPIQIAIDSKRRLYDAYRDACDECWLLVGAEGDRQSSAIRPDEVSRTHRYAAAFDRTFLVHLVYQDHHELFTR